VPLFTAWPDDALARLGASAQRKILPKGETLYRPGDPGDAFFLLLSGRLDVIAPEKGADKLQAVLARRGDHLGDRSLLTGSPQTHTVRAESTSELLVFSRADVERQLMEHPPLALEAARAAWSAAPPVDHSPGSRILGVVGLALPEDRSLFLLSLARSLTEQSRRKVIVVNILESVEDPVGRLLGLAPLSIGEHSLRQEDAQSPATLNRLARDHSSGLRYLVLPLSLLNDRWLSVTHPFAAALRHDHDLVLLALPPRLTAGVRALLLEVDRLLTVEGEGHAGGDVLATLKEILSVSRLYRVQLLTDTVPPRRSPGRCRIPWTPGLGGACAAQGSAFVPETLRRTRIAIDRLARELTGLRLGLALGSGAALGYASIGLLRVLERNGIYPDVLAGTSMGALLASFYASGRTPDEIADIARGITRLKLWGMMDFTLPWQGLLLGRGVLRFLKSILGDITFDQLPLPFACVATDIGSGQEVVLKHGRVAEAVRGSLSLPFYFQPFFHRGRFLVDGGLVNPVPTSVLTALGADIRLAVNVTVPPERKHLPGIRSSLHRHTGPSLLEIMAKTIYTMQYRIAVHTDTAHLALSPDVGGYAWMEFDRADDILRAGEDYAESMLPKIRALLPAFHGSCPVPPSSQ
jgi:NTE family protein